MEQALEFRKGKESHTGAHLDERGVYDYFKY